MHFPTKKKLSIYNHIIVLIQMKKKDNQKPVEKEEVEIKSLRLKHITQKKNYSINGKNCL
jgi:ABC-type lipopolysaccharide export system ATPase subunit